MLAHIGAIVGNTILKGINNPIATPTRDADTVATEILFITASNSLFLYRIIFTSYFEFSRILLNSELFKDFDFSLIVES